LRGYYGVYNIVVLQACWVLHYFSEIRFKNEQVLADALRLTTNALLTDNELPVKVEAAIALQMFLNSQDAAIKYIEPQVRNCMLASLILFWRFKTVSGHTACVMK